jgi:hypothetical protein
MVMYAAPVAVSSYQMTLQAKGDGDRSSRRNTGYDRRIDIVALLKAENNEIQYPNFNRDYFLLDSGLRR